MKQRRKTREAFNHTVTRIQNSECGDNKTDTEGKLKAKEYCRTLFAYEGTNEDELTFKEGEIIQLISKETGETGWWKGELNGKEGVFPDNFAVQINELDKDFPKPKKPPPPAKGPISKPELVGTEKKYFPTKHEEKEKSDENQCWNRNLSKTSCSTSPTQEACSTHQSQ